VRSVFRSLLRRPDVWVGVASFAIVVVVFPQTSLRLLAIDRVLFNHLADSFGVGMISVFVGVLVQLLLRAAPPAVARTLRLGWLILVAATTLGLLFSFAHPARTSTNWILQSLVLAVLGWSLVLGALLAACGIIRARDALAACREIGRNWAGVGLYLATGGYLLSLIRWFTPEVFDPLLLRMDASLSSIFVSSITRWTFAEPLARYVSEYAYPMLGFFIAAVAARLQLAGEIAQLRRYLTAVVFVAFVGPVCYWAVPAVGPIHAWPALFRPEAASAETVAGLMHGSATMPFGRTLLRNVMPSLHTTFTLVALVALAAFRPRRWEFTLWLPLAASQIITTLTLGVHYVVDLIAAVPLAVLCWALAEAAVRRFPPPDERPLPELPGDAAVRDRRVLTLGATWLVSVAALIAWGVAAPISPLLAWPLTALIMVAPTFAALRLFRAPPATANVPRPAPLRPAPPSLLEPRVATRLLGSAVFCTGGTALILEQVAEKYLSTLLGSSRPAATLVLVVYFAGLALGAALCPKTTVSAPRRLAALELFIAAWCALLALAFFAVDQRLGAWLAAQDSSAFALSAGRAAVAVLWLLPPTLAMGAQLPTLAATLRSTPVLAGASLPRLYALNLAGACAFTFVAPPLLFGLIGANGALWFAAGLGALVGLALWAGLPRGPAGNDAPAPHPAKESGGNAATTAVVASFAAGFAFFALEVVWFHLIGAGCGASVYTFSLLLGLVLLGLALAGSSVAGGREASLPTLLAGLALTLGVTSAGWPWLGRALASANGLLSLEWFWAGELLKTAGVAVLVLPPAVLLGQIFPRVLRDSGGDGARVGRLSFANVLGCVAGALAAGLVFIPQLGAERTLDGIAALAALGALAHWVRTPGRTRALALAGLASVFLLPAWDRLELTRGFGVYLADGVPADARLVWFREDFSAGFVTVTAREDDAGRTVKTLLQNGKFDANDAGEVPAQVSFGLLAALHAPSTERALVIGAGSGQTAAIVAQLGFKHLDIAELSPAHIAAARTEFAHLHGGVFDRPDVAVHLEDGRNFLLRARDAYDVIQIEITSLWFAGATNLYSREFYALARARLAPGGALVQWIQLHHLAPREIATILATARAEFPSVAVWRAGPQACLIATDGPARLNLPVWQRWLNDPALAAARAAAGITSPETLAPAELLTAPRVDALLNRHRGAYGLNTDRNRWIEFQSPKYYLSRFNHTAANLRWLASAPLPPPPK
jgi:spermidine synthase